MFACFVVGVCVRSFLCVFGSEYLCLYVVCSLECVYVFVFISGNVCMCLSMFAVVYVLVCLCDCGRHICVCGHICICLSVCLWVCMHLLECMYVCGSVSMCTVYVCEFHFAFLLLCPHF